MVRHAHAGQRSAWPHSDESRPLSAKGEAQADAIAERFADQRVERFLSSRATRCVATLTPMAGQSGAEIVTDDRLFEGAGLDEIRSLLADLTDRTTALCSHGDVIPTILRQLIDDGMAPADPLRWSKASVWTIDAKPDGWGVGRYTKI